MHSRLAECVIDEMLYKKLYPNENIWHNTTTTIDDTDYDDAWMSSSAATTNYGADTRLLAENSPARNIIFKFDVSSIGSDQQVDSAQMKWFRVTHVDGQVMYHAIDGRVWVEAEGTWNVYSTGNSWTSGGGDYGAAFDSITHYGASQTAGTGDGIDVTDSVFTIRGASGGLSDIVEDWIDGTTTNYGIIAVGEDLGTDAMKFEATEGDPSVPPYILIVHSTAGAPSSNPQIIYIEPRNRYDKNKFGYLGRSYAE